MIAIMRSFVHLRKHIANLIVHVMRQGEFMANVLVVGAGISGCVAARLLAEKGYDVLIVDRRNNIGGNAYDAQNAAGITIQMHGPHIFHAKDSKAWDFLSRFTDWRPYQHRVLSYVEGRYVPIPINIDTINQLYGFSHDADSIGQFFTSRRERVDKPKNMRDAVVSRVGHELYELFFKNYTKKQWGLDAEELPVSLAGRASARENRDSRLYTDPYQGVPEGGYTAMFHNMLNHPSIEVRLNCPYRSLPDDLKRQPTVYTGCIDEYFNYRFGRLPYRSVRFVYKTYECQQYQPAAVINYPNDYDFIRSTEFKHWTGESSPQTTVVYEYPRDDGEPYYPLPTLEARTQYHQYVSAAEALPGMHFIGPFGRYKHMDMNHAANDAMQLVDKHFPSSTMCSVVVLD